jgi:hypothetical protein
LSIKIKKLIPEEQEGQNNQAVEKNSYSCEEAAEENSNR